MPCEWYRTPDGTLMHIHRSRAGGSFECRFCGRRAKREDAKLCDFPLGNGKTCDAQMCAACAVTLGRQETEIGGGMKRVNDTIDVCPIHRSQAMVSGGEVHAEAEAPAIQGDLFEGAR